METADFSEILVCFYKVALCHILEDSSNAGCSVNLKSCIED